MGYLVNWIWNLRVVVSNHFWWFEISKYIMLFLCKFSYVWCKFCLFTLLRQFYYVFLGLDSYLLQVRRSFDLDVMCHLGWFVLFGLHVYGQMIVVCIWYDSAQHPPPISYEFTNGSLVMAHERTIIHHHKKCVHNTIRTIDLCKPSL